MTKKILFALLLLMSNATWSDSQFPGLQVDVKRDGDVYTLNASFDSTLTQCAAYQYLTDYAAATKLPGVVESLAYRQSSNKVRVERTADEQVLFFHVRLHSILEFTETPTDGIQFTQLKGDSKTFTGSWHIEPKQQGTRLRFQGTWEPDTLIPLFIIDHFAKNGLEDKFKAIAQLAEQRKDITPVSCVN